MQPQNWIGIDPGLHGGVVHIDGAMRAVAAYRTPIIEGGEGAKSQYDERAMAALVIQLLQWSKTTDTGLRFCIEDVAAAPGQGVVSMFRFGVGYGIWLGILAGTGCPVHKIKPQAWQRVAFSGRPAVDKKQTSLLVAKELFPELPLKSKSADSGISDAALIALACARIYTPKATSTP